MRLARALPLVLALAACGAALPPLPSQGGPAWHELASMHFIVWTDASLDRGRELVQQMEWLRSIIYGVAFPDLPPGGKTVVIALHDRREALLYVPPPHTAFTVATGPLGHPMIVMPAEMRDEHYAVTHELTHAISFNAIHAQPRWFSEGIATYFETIHLDMEHGTVDVGEVRRELRDYLEHRGLFFMSHMFGCNALSCENNFKFYATAWSMYAYLHAMHAKQLASFELALASMPEAQAWQQALPDLPPATLDEKIVNWLGYGGYTIAHFKIEKRDWAITERPLADTDVHAIRALLLMVAHPSSPQIDSDLAAADPKGVVTGVVTLQHRKSIPLADARAIAAAHPEDFLAWALVASASKSGDEHDAAIAKICQLIAGDPSVPKPPGC